VPKRKNPRRDAAVDGDQVRDPLDKVNPYQPVGREGMNPRILRDQADDIAGLL